LNSLVVSGMNDVFNSQAHVQASFWNRIPLAAWALMAAIALICNYLLGYTARRHDVTATRFFVLPLIVATSFFLIADIDSPQGGIIRIHPLNLEHLSWNFQQP
jgi:bacteriorhodopsin